MTTLIKEKQISNLIRRTIIESVHSILTDPDFGLEISDNIAKRLKKYSKKAPTRLTSFNNIKKKYS
jgi:hypothetical protein